MKASAIALLVGFAATHAMAQSVAGEFYYQNTTTHQVANFPSLIQYQFGIGAIPNGQCPHVFIDGTEVPSVVNIKSHYDQIDNSVRHVNIQYTIPNVPAGAVPAREGVGRIAVSLQAGDCSNRGQTEKDYPTGLANPTSTLSVNMCLTYMQYGMRFSASSTIWLTDMTYELPGNPPTADKHKRVNCITGQPVQ